MPVIEVLGRLNSLLPLKQRQQALPAPLQRLHKRILRSLYSEARELGLADIKNLLAGADPRQALKVLAKADLVVLDDSGDKVVGAYPMTLEDTPHHLTLHDLHINAMCALDAVSVAPLFDCHVEIRSRCQVTDTEIFIYQQGKVVLATNAPVSGQREIQIGIRWQDPGACAAHRLCREMVFLKDVTSARNWQQSVGESAEFFGLTEAIEIGAAFFCPLLGGSET